MGNIQLSISILISNHYDRVKRCLDSVRPLLEAIPSELILTDTGCDARTREMIEGYSDHIINFTWCQDFAAARNVGVHEAVGEWFLYIDDDEWFNDVTPIVDFLNSKEAKEYNVAFYIVRSFTNSECTKYRDNYVDRLIRRTSEFHFIHRVHETYCGVTITGKKMLPCVAWHDGYIYSNEEEKEAKQKRNRPLLEQECGENPDDLRMRYQMLMCQYALGDFDEAIAGATRAIEENADSDSEFLDACHSGIVYCYYGKKDWNQVIDTGKEFLKKHLYPQDSFGILQMMIDAEYALKQPVALCQLGDAAIDIYLEYLENPEIFNPNQLKRQDYLDDESVQLMLAKIMVAAIATSDDPLLEKIMGSSLANLANAILNLNDTMQQGLDYLEDR